MKTSYRLLSSLLVFLATSPFLAAQQKPEAKGDPAHKLVEFHMALVKRGPKWTAAENPETTRVYQDHFNYVLSLMDSGKAVIAGPFTDGGEIGGVFVFR